ncbi:MAG: molybdopterin-dependent oxidoreductase [Thermoanaerobaculia bacterium]
MTSEIHRTTCVLDCPDACALEVEVREGRIERIGGSQDHPDTNGFICGKVAGFADRVYHPERLLHPLRRVGAKGERRFERISWDDAITETCDRLGEIRDRWSGEAILPYHYGGSNGLVSDGLLDALFFSRLGASRLEKTICAVPTTEVALGMYGKMPGVAFEDFVHSRCIVVWGANPKASNIHLVPYLRQAKKNGAFVATVDPRRNFSTEEVDLHLPVRPGSDLPVALAMIAHWERQGSLDLDFLREQAVDLELLLERARAWSLEQAAAVAGVEALDIERLARELAAGSPAVIRCGWGIERNRNGGQAVAAVLAMPALLGKFGVRGGGYTMSNTGAFRFDPTTVVGPLADTTRSINMTRLGRALGKDLEPPVKGLFVYNANPAVTVPGQRSILRGLARDDLFTVVFDQVMTDTAAYADVVLPAATFLEGRDLRGGYGSFVVGGVRPVIEPRGEARTNAAVFSALGRAMGWEDEPFLWDEEKVFSQVAAAVEMTGRRPGGDRLEAGGCERHDFPGGTPIQFGTVHPRTADGRIHLTPAVLGPEPYRFQAPDDGLPLALITPASSRMVNSTLGESNYPRLSVDLHPRDAEARGIQPGDQVRVFNDLGEVDCVAAINERLRPGVVAMPKGAWRHASLNGETSTALCPDHLNIVGGAACFNDARVDVGKI